VKKQNYKAIILPPDHHHISMTDTFFKLNQYLPSIINVLLSLNFKKNEIYIKYRSEIQKKNFPINTDVNVFDAGYGTLKNYLKKDIIVIGTQNSATIECLVNDIKYYSFEYLDSFYANRATDLKSLDEMKEIIYIANNIDELKINLKNNNLFKQNKNKNDLIYSDSLYINEIVDSILKNL